MIRRLWPAAAAGGLLVLAALAHGWQTDRWSAPADLSAAAVRLDTVPMRIGDWEGATVELPPEQVKEARVAGLLSRRYKQRYTKAEVTVLLLCARPGPISVHTPDICYQGSGFTMGPNRVEPLGEANTAWVADFKKGGAQPASLRIRWAWSTGGTWTASNSPRFEFARAPILFKLYLVRAVPSGGDPVPAGGDPKDHLPELQFANEFLPILQTVLNPLP